MDRAAEIWLLARRWREALGNAPDCRVVANADDPLVAWAAGASRQVTWVAAGQRWREDSVVLPALRRPPAARRRRLVLPGVRQPAPAGELDALRRRGDRPVRPGPPARPRAARPGQPVQRGRGAGGRGGVRRAHRARASRTARRHLGGGPVHAGEPARLSTSGCCWRRTPPAGWRRSTCWRRRPRPVLLVGQRAGTRRQGHLVAVGRRLPPAARQDRPGRR